MPCLCTVTARAVSLFIMRERVKCAHRKHYRGSTRAQRLTLLFVLAMKSITVTAGWLLMSFSTCLSLRVLSHSDVSVILDSQTQQRRCHKCLAAVFLYKLQADCVGLF